MLAGIAFLVLVMPVQVLGDHNELHSPSNDITVDFTATGVDLTGNASDYDIGGLHLDGTHVYVALNSPSDQRGVYKFDTAGVYVAHESITDPIMGLAGNSTHIWVGQSAVAERYLKSTLAAVPAGTENLTGTSGPSVDSSYFIGEVFTRAGTEHILHAGKDRLYSGYTGETRDYPIITNNRIGSSTARAAPQYVRPAFVEAAGFTADSLDGVDLTTDGSGLVIFVESGDGKGVFAFEDDPSYISSGIGADGAEPNILRDVTFSKDGGYDGLFYNGTLLWSVDLNSFNAADDTMVLRAFNPGVLPIPDPDEVTSVDGSFIQEVRTRYWTCGPDPCTLADLQRDGGARSVGYDDVLKIDLDGDGVDDTTTWTDGDGNKITVPLRFYAADGFRPTGMWGDGRHIYAVDPHTRALAAIAVGDLLGGTFEDTSVVKRYSMGAPLEVEDGDRSEGQLDEPPHLMYPRAMWGDSTHIWLSDNNNRRLRAFDRKHNGRAPDLDVTLGLNGHVLVVMGIWANDDTMWVNAVPYRPSGKRSKLPNGIYKVDRSTGAVSEASGFNGLDKAHASRGLWSDGHTMWVAAPANNRIRAYNLETGARERSHEIVLEPNHGSKQLEAGGIWSDGTYMYVGDRSSGEIQIYCLTGCN